MSRAGWARATWVFLVGFSAAAAVPTVLALFAAGGLGWLLGAAAIPALVAAASVVASDGARGHPLAERGWSRLVVAAGGVAALVAAVPSGPQGNRALTGLGSGLDRLFTTALPTAPVGPELGVTMVAVAVAAGAGAELARRDQTAWWPVVPTVVLYLAALVVGAGGPPAPSWGAVPVVGAAALVGVARGVRLNRPAGRVLGSGVAVAAVVGLALPIGTNLPGAGSRAPYDVRAAVASPPQLASEVNVLASYAAVYDGPVRPVFTVRGFAVRGFTAPGGGIDPRQLEWRLATFDHFNGTDWVSTDSFQRAGVTLPAGPAIAVPAATVNADVALSGSDPLGPVPYLPVPGRPQAVSVDGLAISVRDGVLAVPAGIAPPDGYRLKAIVPRPTTDQLLSSVPVPGSDPGSPALPPVVVSAASAVIAHSGPSPFARLTAIATFLTGPGFVRHPPGGSPIGSGSYQVTQLLEHHNGSAEQYAATFALLARAAGFDTRLAVGYTGGTASRRGEVTFTSRDLTVWPEVHMRGMDWLPFPVLPTQTGTGGIAASQETASPLNQALNRQQAINASSPPSSASAQAGTEPAGPGGRIPVWPLVVGIAAGAVVAALGGLAAGRAGRSRRQRRRTDSQRRVIGAWESVVDRLAALGLSVPASLTPGEVAEVTGSHLGPDCAGPVARLGPLVDAARFDRRYPPDESDAAGAWSQADRFGEAVRRVVPWPRRLAAAISPAPWLRS